MLKRLVIRLASVCLCLMTYANDGVWANEAKVWIALSEPGGVYAETAEAIRAEVEQGGGTDVIVKPWQELAPSSAVPPRLVITVGMGALRGLAEARGKAPLLAALVPRAGYTGLATTLTQGGTHSAVWLDQPAARQLALIKLALPGRSKVGVLYGIESRLIEGEMDRASAAARDLVLVGGHVATIDQLPGMLQRVTDEADLLLALPDPQVYNGTTVQNIMTAAYRRRLPLIGFSPAYVRAGAPLALYSTPVQVGVQVGEIARSVLSGRPLPAAQGPRRFSVDINANVARSLGLPLATSDAPRLVEQLRAREGGQ